MSPPENLQIRSATLADREVVSLLWEALMREQEAIEPAFRMAEDARLRWDNEYIHYVRSPVYRFRVAEMPLHGIVGFVRAFQWYMPPLYKQELEVFVGEIYVEPEWRGQGIGGALLADVQQWASACGAVRIRAEVLAANRRSLHFWEKYGARPFTVVETISL